MEDQYRGVLLKGLPFSATKNDIKHFFKNIDIHDEHITIIILYNKRPTGLGFIQMREEDIKKALLNDRNHMSDRYIEVFPSNEVEFYEILLMARDKDVDPKEIFKIAGRRGDKWRDRSPVRRRLSTKYAYFSGVPKGMTYKHVREFFKGCLIGHNCIHMLKGEGGSFRGDGYIEFGNSDECMKGLRMNGVKERGSVIEVVPCCFDEMTAVVGKINGSEIDSEDLRATLSSRRRSSRRERRHTPSPVRKRLKAYAATYGGGDPDEYRETSYSKGNSRYSLGEGSDRYENHHRSRREEYEDRRPWQHEESIQEPPSHRPAGYTNYQEPSVPSYIPVQENPQGASYNKMGYVQPQPYASSGKPERKMVRLEGLPYEVTVRDIMTFFEIYQLQHEQIRIQCRDDGSPSGKAFVVFASEKHARAAVQSHDKTYLMGRYVDLVHI